MRVAEGLVAYIAEHSGAAQVVLSGVEDSEAAQHALAAARAALFTIPHPEEPGDPLPSFASDVSVGPGGPTFWFDIADAEAYDGLIDRVVQVMTAAIELAGVDGVLTWPEDAAHV